MKADKQFNAELQSAEKAVRSLEQIRLGADDCAAVIGRAVAALDALQQVALAAAFPQVVQATPDGSATLEFNIFGTRQEFPQRVLAIHAWALEAGSSAAPMIRSAAMLNRVGATTSVSVEDLKTEPHRIRGFARAIAQQLLDAKHDDPAATILAVTVPPFEQRVAIVREAHAAYATEQQRIAAAQAAEAAQQQLAAERAGQQDLLDWFNRHSNAMFSYYSARAAWSCNARSCRPTRVRRRPP